MVSYCDTLNDRLLTSRRVCGSKYPKALPYALQRAPRYSTEAHFLLLHMHIELMFWSFMFIKYSGRSRRQRIIFGVVSTRLP